MHTEMWEHPATVENVRVLRERGVTFVEPESGELAGGDVGTGRLAETSTIVATCEHVLLRAPARGQTTTIPTGDLAGTTVLVSAGGTREAIDPVRFIGNRSSGRQGHAIALAARDRGAHVQLVTTVPGDPQLAAATGIEVVPVESAQQMHDAMLARAESAGIVVMCAAVADFRPADCSDVKLKRRDGLPQITLEPTPNILRALVAARTPDQVVVGFAAETDHLGQNAAEKLGGSGADLIVANDVSRPDAGFEHPTNAVTILRAGGLAPIDVPLADKRTIAERVLDASSFDDLFDA